MKKKILILLILSMLYITVFPIFKKNVIDLKYTILLTNSGEKDTKSGGTEVWIDSIEVDGIIIDNNNLILPGGWNREGRIFSLGKSEDLKLAYHYKKQVKINFIRHPYSGKVIIYNGKDKQDKKINLYKEKEEIFTYVIKR